MCTRVVVLWLLLPRVGAVTWDGSVTVSSGEVVLPSTSSLTRLYLSGGVVRLSDACPDGWVSTVDGCAIAFASPLAWADAERACAAAAGEDDAPARGHLALVGSDETNAVVAALCAEASAASSLRSESEGLEETAGLEFAVNASDCWIGASDSLADASGSAAVSEQISRPSPGGAALDDGAWAWVDEGSVVGERLYRSWARREPRFEAKDNCAAVLHRGSALSPASPARRYLF